MTAAGDYYAGREEAASADLRAAKAIIWYDQQTPLFVCEGCHEHARSVRFAGDAFDVDDYETRRANAYRRLFEDAPDCDLCSGRLPEKVEL